MSLVATSIVQDLKQANLDLRARILELEKENLCDVCHGESKDHPDIICICGGSGKMSVAASNLREQLIKAHKRLNQLGDRTMSSIKGLQFVLTPRCPTCGSELDIQCELLTAGEAWMGATCPKGCILNEEILNG